MEEGEELGESDEPDDGEVSEGSVELEDDEVSEHREHSEERRAWRRHEDSEGRPDSDTMPQTRSHRTWQASQGTASVEFGGAQAWSSPYRVSLREDQGSVTLYTTIRNSGSESIDAWATFTVRDRSGRPVYHEDSDHVTLAPGAATTVSVRTALATIGRYTGKVSLQMGDGSDGPAAPFRFNVSW